MSDFSLLGRAVEVVQKATKPQKSQRPPRALRITAPSGKVYRLKWAEKREPTQADLDRALAQIKGMEGEGAGVGATVPGKKLGWGKQVAEEANKITGDLATALHSRIEAPVGSFLHDLFGGGETFEDMVSADIKKGQIKTSVDLSAQAPPISVSGLVAGIATIPLHLAGDTAVLVDPASTLEERGRATLNILGEVIGPAEALAVFKGVKPLTKQMVQAVAKKAGIPTSQAERSLKAVVGQAKKEGVDVTFRPTGAKGKAASVPEAGSIPAASTKKPQKGPKVEKEQPKEAPKTSPTTKTGLANVVQDAEHLWGVIDEVEKTKGKGVEYWQKVGKNAVDDGADYDDLANKIASGETELTGKGVGILLEGKRQKLDALNKARQRLDEAIERGAGVKEARADYELANDSLNEFLEKVQLGKGRWSDVGRALQAGVDVDTGNFANVLSEFERRAGRRATTREQTGIAKEVKAIQEEVKKAVPDYDPTKETIYQALERAKVAAVTEAKATEGVTRVFQNAAKRSGKRTVEVVRGERQAARTRIGEIFSKSVHGPMGSGGGALQDLLEAVPELAREVRKYIELTIEEFKLKTLDSRFYETMRAELDKLDLRHPETGEKIDFTDSDIRATFAKHYETTSRTPSEATKNLNELRKQADLTEKIEAALRGDTIPKGKGVPSPSQEVKLLREKLNQLLKATGDDPAGAGVRTRLENMLKDLEAQKAGGYRNLKGPKRDELFKDLRAKIAEVRKDMRLEDKISDLEEQLRTGNLRGPSKRVEAVTRSQEFQKSRILNLEKQVRARLNAAKRGWVEKTLRNVAEPIRGTILGSDIGTMARQGAFSIFARPVHFARGVGKGLYSALSDTHLTNFERGLAERTINVPGRGIVPAAPIQKKAGLQITSDLTDPEEIVSTRLLHALGVKIEDVASEIPVVGKPLGAVLGRPFGALRRFQAGLINSVRADVFDFAVRHGYTEKELAQRAAFINNATGRGNLKNVPGIFQLIMTSPRYEVSRWAMPGEALRNPIRFGADLATGKGYNKAAAANMQDMAVTAAGIYGLMKVAELSGYKADFRPFVEKDGKRVRNPDFLKMRKGDEVWDVTAGIAPRLQDAMGVILAFEEPDWGQTVLDVAKRAGGRAASPALKTPVQQFSYMRQRAKGRTEDELKDPFTGFVPEEEEKGWMAWAPLIYRTFWRELQQGGSGVEGAVKAGAKEFVGTSVNRYPPPGKR
jgi:hypothetical protein